jgi:polyhydroxybutyrate depolymerase
MFSSIKKILRTFIILIFILSISLTYAQIQTGNFDFEGRNRNYMVFLPNNYTGTLNFPLVIYLHSYGWTANQGMNYTLLNQVADTSNFIVAYPSAIPNWNSGIGDNPNWPTPGVDDVGFINALIDTLSNHYSIDLEKIYACGYSNGGFMAYKLACQLSHRIAAIASVGGVISSNTEANCNPLRTMPVLQIHGTNDPWVSINGNTGWLSVDQTLSYWTNYNNCVEADTIILPDLDQTDGCSVEKISYTNCSNVIYYKVINGGHTWPGAGPPGYPAGNTNQDIHASTLILNFFKKL